MPASTPRAGLPRRVGFAFMALLVLATAMDWGQRLEAQDPQARRQAIHALADQGGAQALQTLARRIPQESDPAVRRALVDGMMRVEVDPATLLTLAQDPGSPDLRAFAVHQLGRLHDDASRKVLLASMGDPSEDVRREAYEAVGSTGDRTFIPDVVRAAVREPSPALRQVAEQAASRLASARGAAMDVSTSIGLLEAGSPPDQVQAALTLGRSSDWRALDPLVRALGSSAPEVRRAAIMALGVLGDHRAVKPLQDLLARSGGETRVLVVEALGLLRDESTFDGMAALVKDPDPRCRTAALSALVHLPGGGGAMAPALQDADETVRAAAIHALARIGDPAAMDLLASGVRDPSPFNRAEVARLLADQGAVASIPTLLPLLEDRDALVKLSAADALVRLGAAEALPRICKLGEAAKREEEKQIYMDMCRRLESTSSPTSP